MNVPKAFAGSIPARSTVRYFSTFLHAIARGLGYALVRGRR